MSWVAAPLLRANRIWRMRPRSTVRLRRASSFGVASAKSRTCKLSDRHATTTPPRSSRIPAVPCASTCSYPSAAIYPIAQSISSRPRSCVSVSTASAWRGRPLSCSF
eukprot:876300-Prymnesium_polylepis.1